MVDCETIIFKAKVQSKVLSIYLLASKMIKSANDMFIHQYLMKLKGH